VSGAAVEYRTQCFRKSTFIFSQALIWLCDFAGKSERQDNTATSRRLGIRG